MQFLGKPEPRLPYPTKKLVMQGEEFEEYIIPDDKKAEVLDQMYLFDPVPDLDEERFDLHSGKLFKVRDFRVTREHDRNWLVSPYYEEAGGTVIDWMPASWALPESDEDWDEEYEEDGECVEESSGLSDEGRSLVVKGPVLESPQLEKLKAYMMQQAPKGGGVYFDGSKPENSN